MKSIESKETNTRKKKSQIKISQNENIVARVNEI